MFLKTRGELDLLRLVTEPNERPQVLKLMRLAGGASKTPIRFCGHESLSGVHYIRLIARVRAPRIGNF